MLVSFAITILTLIKSIGNNELFFSAKLNLAVTPLTLIPNPKVPTISSPVYFWIKVPQNYSCLVRAFSILLRWTINSSIPSSVLEKTSLSKWYSWDHLSLLASWFCPRDLSSFVVFHTVICPVPGRDPHMSYVSILRLFLSLTNSQRCWLLTTRKVLWFHSCFTSLAPSRMPFTMIYNIW